MTAPPDTTEVAVLVARALEAAGVDYAMGGELIDLSYLRKWASYHGISDLLERALTQRAL